MRYKKGDVTKANEPGIKFLPHIVNCYGIAESGVVCAIEKMEGNPIQQYRKWYIDREYVTYNDLDNPTYTHFNLGEVQFCQSNDFIVCNMVAQKWTEKINGKQVPAIRLGALAECMERVAEYYFFLSKNNPTSIVAPKFGSERAGGDWNRDIVPLIESIWKDIPVTIYEY